jgi:Protein of unknown function (DUF3142)
MKSRCFLEELRRSRSQAALARLVSFFGVFAVVIAVAGWVLRIPNAPPLVHEGYVWQRSWNEELGKAIIEAGTGLDGLLYLAGEIVVENGNFKTLRIPVNHSAVRQAGDRPTAVIRIFPSVASGGWTPQARESCDGLLGQIIEEWSREHVGGVALQIDFDCPESRLAEFHEQMREWKNQFPSVPITFTALPSWLVRPEFTALASEFPDYVLQVHSLHLPEKSGRWAGLCDPTEMRMATQAAAKLGVPFRLALPTYSCLVVFDENGKVAEVYGEDLPESLPVGALDTMALDSDAYLLASMVREWERARPELMTGIVWYRLPAPGDRLNWDWALLERVIIGLPLTQRWSLRADPDPAGYHRIVLRNDGDAPDDLPLRIRLRVPGARVSGSDGLSGYIATELVNAAKLPEANFEWHLLEPLREFQKPSGWSGVVGWCRWQGGNMPPDFEFSID